MSSMTNMIIHAEGGEEDAIARLNAWCAQVDPRQQQFERLDTDAAGGVKVFTNTVLAMCGNYFPYELLADAFPSFGWRYPEDAVLIIAHDQDDASRVYRASEVAPE